MALANDGYSHTLNFSHPPRRVVSLVPSMTESLFDLGFGPAVVGITDYCLHPAGALGGLPRLGGPKNPRVGEILALEPDLVIANWEENTRQTVDALEAQGIVVWVTFPRSVDGSMELLWKLAELFRSQPAVLRLKTLEVALDWTRSTSAGQDPSRVFCPIWYDQLTTGEPWFMSFDRRTYCHDLLAVCGGANVFAERPRRYPLDADLKGVHPEDPAGRDTRYPRISLEEVLQAAPEVILLPSEPFDFDETYAAEVQELLSATPAVREGRVRRVDGSLITWHGTRLAHALRELPALLAL